MQPAIRRSRASDLLALQGLLRSAGLPTEDLTSAPGLQFWISGSERHLLGVIGLERFGANGLLRSLAVAPERRRCGLGGQLVARLERDARAEGVQQLALLTETAEGFFRRLGYEVIDRSDVDEELKQSAEFRLLCPASAVCMTKSLVPRSTNTKDR